MRLVISNKLQRNGELKAARLRDAFRRCQTDAAFRALFIAKARAACNKIAPPDPDGAILCKRGRGGKERPPE
jgi:hypothetical protein